MGCVATVLLYLPLLLFFETSRTIDVVSVGYWNNDNLSNEYGVAKTEKIIVIDFSDESYVSINCSVENKSPPLFVPCCQNNNNTTCYSVPQDYICVDDNNNLTSVFENKPYNNGGNPLLISWQFQNHKTCTGFGVSLIDIVGHSQYSLFAGVDIFEISNGPPSSFWCCEEVSQTLFSWVKKDWDGSVFLKVFPYLFLNNDTNARFKVILENDIHHLPTKYFWNQARVELVDDSYPPLILVSQNLCEGNALSFVLVDDIISQKCDFLYPPRSDPLYYYFHSPVSGDDEPIPDTLPNRLMFSYRELVVDFSKTEIINNTLPIYRLRLKNIVDRNGNLVSSDVLPLSPYFKEGSSCNYPLLKHCHEEFEIHIEYLKRSVDIDGQFLYGVVLAPITSINWLGCEYHAKNFLSTPVIEWELSEPTSECIDVLGTFEYANNPCCNSSLLDVQCCFPQQYLKKTISYSPKVLDKTNCLAPICAKESLSQINTLSYSSLLDLNKKCNQLSDMANLFKSFSGGNTDVPLLTLCRHFLESSTQCNFLHTSQICNYYSGGLSDSICLYSDQTVPLTSGQDTKCSVPCKSDSDCVFGSYNSKCRMHGYYNSCEPIHPRDSNFWLSPEAVDPLISCIADYISNYDEKSKFQIYFDLNLNFTPEAPPGSPAKLALDSALKEYLIVQGCSESIVTEYPSTTSIQCDPKETRCNWVNGQTNDLQWDCINVPPPMNKDGFCGLCSDPQDDTSSCAQLSQNGECLWGNEYSQYDLDEWGLTFLGVIDNVYSRAYCEQNLNGKEYNFRLGCMIANFTEELVSNTTMQFINGTFHNITTLETVKRYPRERCILHEFCMVSDRFHEVADGMDHNLVYSEVCEAYCYWNKVNETTCIQHGFQWVNWTKDGAIYTKCLVPGVFYSHCDAWIRYYHFENVLWWPGASWFPPMFETPEKCNSFCRYDLSLNQSQCLSNRHCSNTLCLDNCNKENCEHSGICAIHPGCYIEFDNESSCENYDLSSFNELNGILFNWFPWGCGVAYSIPINEITCQRIAQVTKRGYFFLSYSDWVNLNQSECENIGWKYCFTSSTPFLFQSQADLNPTAKIYDSIHWKACQNCRNSDTKVQVRWYNGIWTESDDQWMEVSWRSRKEIPLVNITDSIDQPKLNKLLREAFKSTQLQLLKGFTLCKEGNMKDILLQLACLTGDDRNNHTTELCKETYEINQLVADTTICSHLPFVYEYVQFGTFTVTEDFKLKNFVCLENTIYLLLQSQYSLHEQDILIKLPVPASQSNKGQFQSVTNSKNVIVGKMIGNGVKFSISDPTGNTTPPYIGLEACIELEKIQTVTSDTIQSDQKLWIGVSDQNFMSLTPIDKSFILINQTNSSQICFIVTDSMIVFPISIQTDFESITYVSTFSSVEVGMLCFGFVVYSAVVILGIAILCEHIIVHQTIYFLKGSIECLSATAISTLRILFWSLILSETSNQEVAFIFLAEFPALILFSTLTLIVTKLTFAYERSTSRTVKNNKIPLMFLCCVIFVALLLLFVIIFTAMYPQEIAFHDCFNPDSSSINFYQTPVDIATFLYLMIFLICGLFMISALIYYSQFLVRLVTRTNTISVKPLIFLAVSVSLSLLAQCFFIVAQLALSWGTVGIIAYLVVVDLHTLLLLLHNSHTANTLIHSRSTSSTSKHIKSSDVKQSDQVKSENAFK